MIQHAEFIMSNTDVEKCPAPDTPEYAFIGRSNVGKSSLINMLTGRKSLAKISGTPGKTQLINHFKIDNTWYLVDLPGYGYARVSKSLKSSFQKIIRSYLDERKNLVCTFVLIDVRHEPQKVDTEFMEWLGNKGIPFCIIFTKADKISSSILHKNLTKYKKEMLKTWEEMPNYFVTSSTTNLGKEDVVNFIESTNKDVAEQIKDLSKQH